MTPTWFRTLCVVPKCAQGSIGCCGLRFTTANPSGSQMAKLQPLPIPWESSLLPNREPEREYFLA